MSVDNAIRFMTRLDNEPEFAAQVVSPDDVWRASAEAGLPFTKDELKQAMQRYFDDLSEEELKATAAGAVCFVCVA